MSQTYAQIATFGKSAYQIRLEVAQAFFVAHHELGPEEAWNAAETFIDAMESRLAPPPDQPDV